MALILDTGVVYAARDRRDDAHAACRQLIEDTDERLVIPAATLPEIDYLLTMRAHPSAVTDLLQDIVDEAYAIEDLTIDDFQRVCDLCARYSDSDIGFVDAAVLAIIERLGEDKLATLDHRHFGMMRPRHVEALRLLPE